MRKTPFALVLAALAVGPVSITPVYAQTQESPRYSVSETPVGKLIDDPKAAAILQEHIPTVWANEMFQSAGRELTLQTIQQYEAVLTDQKLAEIQAALDKISATD